MWEAATAMIKTDRITMKDFLTSEVRALPGGQSLVFSRLAIVSEHFVP
jgi:hypothetical protein